MSNSLDRHSNLSNYKSMSDLPKSGHNLSYSSNVGNLAIGRLYPVGYQHVMGGSKVSGSSTARITFHDMVTPTMSPANVFLYHFYCTHRSVNSDWPDMFNPTERNSMAADLENPMFDLRQVFDTVGTLLVNLLSAGSFSQGNFVMSLVDCPWRNMAAWRSYLQLFDSQLSHQFSNSFCLDAGYDLQPKLLACCTVNNNNVVINTTQAIEFCSSWFDFWCGEGSLLDFFGYPILNHALVQKYVLSRPSSWFVDADGICSVLALLDDYENLPILVNEYPFRHMYAIWYEYFRKPDVEKVSSTLPDYRKWSSVPLLPSALYLLVNRCRSWGADMFNTALVDGLYRHTYAPTITNGATANFAAPFIGGDSSLQYPNIAQQAELLSSVKVPYYDPISGTQKTVTCPVPNGAARMAANYNQDSLIVNSAALDIKTLQRAENISRYLTRVDLGDEYRGRRTRDIL